MVVTEHSERAEAACRTLTIMSRAGAAAVLLRVIAVVWSSDDEPRLIAESARRHES